MGATKERVIEAKEYAKKCWGITEWEVSPFGRSAYIPKEIIDRAIAYIKENSGGKNSSPQG